MWTVPTARSFNKWLSSRFGFIRKEKFSCFNLHVFPDSVYFHINCVLCPKTMRWVSTLNKNRLKSIVFLTAIANLGTSHSRMTTLNDLSLWNVSVSMKWKAFVVLILHKFCTDFFLIWFSAVKYNHDCAW